MYTAIIVDDELNARKFLSNLINKNFSSQIQILELASNIDEAVTLIKKHHPDLVFLDIEMPNETGFDLYKKMGRDICFEVVITTAFKQYALSAIKEGAFDYLLKPIDEMDLTTLIKKLDKKKIHSSNHNFTLNYSDNLPKVGFTTLYGIKYIELYNIIFASADGAYTEIHTVDGKVITTTKSLKDFETLTNNFNFFRCHKSYVINMSYVSELIKKDDNLIVLKNNIRIPLSVRKRDEFQSKFL